VKDAITVWPVVSFHRIKHAKARHAQEARYVHLPTKPITLHHVLMLDSPLEASLACMTTPKLNSSATTRFSCIPARLVRRRCVAEVEDEIERQRPYMQR
jgi:hypothetical protein